MKAVYGYRLVVGWVLVALVGCGASNEEELSQWMANEKATVKPRVVAIAAPKQFTPQAYQPASEMEPFNIQKLTQALKRESSQLASNDALIAKEMARRKDPLEAYPLDTMAMVGSLVRRGEPVGLIKIDNLLYQIRPGGYLGQNYGRVMKISETEITLREIVQDAGGEWVERSATLQLQEGSK